MAAALLRFWETLEIYYKVFRSTGLIVKCLLWFTFALQFPLSPPEPENACDLLMGFGPTKADALLGLMAGDISDALRFLLEDEFSSKSPT